MAAVSLKLIFADMKYTFGEAPVCVQKAQDPIELVITMDTQVPVDRHLEFHYRRNLITELLYLSYLLSYTSISHRFNGAVIPGSLLTVTRRPNLEENTFTITHLR